MRTGIRAAVAALALFSASAACGEKNLPLTPQLFRAVVAFGPLLGLRAGEDGTVRAVSPDPETGRPLSRRLAPDAARRAAVFLSRLPGKDPEPALAAALRSYLRPRMDPRDLDDNPFMKRGPDGVLRLTALGRNALLDVLTAADGDLLGDFAGPGPGPSRAAKPAAGAAVAGRLAAALRGPGAAFDGSRGEGGFDWAALDAELSRPSAGLKAARASVLEGYSVNREAGTVRVMIEAKRVVRKDRLGAGADSADPHSEREAIYREMGLDRGVRKVLERNGVRVRRAMDNLLVVDMPLEKSAKLGLRLERMGIRSSPSRLFKAGLQAVAAGPLSGVLGSQFLPLPSAGAGPAAFLPKNLDSRDLMKVGSLWSAGMTGAGVTVGLVDSSVDASHPDFEGRLLEVRDFSGDGDVADTLGHGTHVAGSVGGSGAASGGLYRGTAPEVRFAVAKVFGKKGDASEDAIAAAMKWLVERGAEVLNLSLGGPEAPNRGILGSLANRLAVERNVSVVAAAGNEGPGPGTVSSPGSARYVTSVTGVNKKGEFSFFPSRGPVTEPDGDVYVQPTVATVAGDVLAPRPESWLARLLSPSSAHAAPAAPGCVFGPGVISARSGADADESCVVAGNPRYRFMSGTSMAAPLAAGITADVRSYVKAGGDWAQRSDPKLALQVRAALQETASHLGAAREVEGAGLLDGEKLARAVVERVGMGLPVGNLAFGLAMRMITTEDRKLLRGQARYQETPLGLLDSRTGRLVNSERRMEAVVRELRRTRPALVTEPRRL